MGIRLNIYIESDPNNYYGDDHKMYGYWAYEEVKKSFDYLAEIIRAEYPEWAETNKDFYSTIFCYGAGLEVTLTNEQFREFTNLYLADLVSTGHTESCVKAATKYMTLLADKDEDKVLDWC